MAENPLEIPVPDFAGPGPSIDASQLGAFPEGQLSHTATSADRCTLETAASSDALEGKFIRAFGGGNVSANLSQTRGGAAALTTPFALAFVRAVRTGGTTPGLVLNLASTNLGSKGPTGAPGAPVQGTLVTDAVGGITLQQGQVGIATVAIVNVAGQNQIEVTFTTAFKTANYSVDAQWFVPSLAPLTVLRGIGYQTGVLPNDGRLPSSVVFALVNSVGAAVDPAAEHAVIQFACLGGP